MFADIRYGAVPRVTALALVLGTAACLGDRSVGGTAESTSQVSAALAAGAILWIDGTYGAGCIVRSGSWSLRVSGAAAMDYPALSVIKNNGACTLTLTSIVADTAYVATPSFTLGTSYQAGASICTSSANLVPTKDANVNAGRRPT